MKLTKNIFVLLLILFTLPFNGTSCVVDVTVVEGATIEMCADAPLTISGSNGFVSYAWTGPETIAGQTITPQFSGLYTVAATDGVGCISTASIQVTIYTNPTPIIVSSEGNPICPSGGSTLSLSNPYVSYDWEVEIRAPHFLLQAKEIIQCPLLTIKVVQDKALSR